MAKIETHIDDCIAILGKGFKEVHVYMDEFAKIYPIQTYFDFHRKFKHNSKGVEEVSKKFGFYGGQAAKLHIIRDYEMYLLEYIEIKNIREDQIEELYQRVLEFCHES